MHGIDHHDDLVTTGVGAAVWAAAAGALVAPVTAGAPETLVVTGVSVVARAPVALGAVSAATAGDR
jgi:hypothetical protein